MAEIVKGGQRLDVSVAIGDTLTLSFVVQQAGELFDWGGATVEWEIDDVSYNAEVDIDTDGILVLRLSSAQTAALGIATHRHFLRVTQGGEATVWFAGEFKVRRADEPTTGPTSLFISVATSAEILLSISGGVAIGSGGSSGGGGGGGGSSSTGAVLNEDGGRMLNEDGGVALLETA